MLIWMNVPIAGGALREYQLSCEEGLRNNLLNSHISFLVYSREHDIVIDQSI